MDATSPATVVVGTRATDSRLRTGEVEILGDLLQPMVGYDV